MRVDLDADDVEQARPVAIDRAMRLLERPIGTGTDRAQPALVGQIPAGDAAAAVLARRGEDEQVDELGHGRSM